MAATVFRAKSEGPIHHDGVRGDSPSAIVADSLVVVHLRFGPNLRFGSPALPALREVQR
jgi:hypothetical protein